MKQSLRRFPRSSALLLTSGIAAIFLTAAAPAQSPVPAPAASDSAAVTPAQAAPVPTQPPVAPVAMAPKVPMPKELSVTIDQTRMIDLDVPVSTVSVGNPSIADVNIQSQRIFLIGKSFGRTNVVALNKSGETVLDMMVFVTSSGGGSVTVYKGSHQLTYNCAPNCDRTLMPGDSKDDFDSISNQMTTKSQISLSKSGE